MTARRLLCDPADPHDRAPRPAETMAAQRRAAVPARDEPSDELLDENSARPLPEPESEGRI